MTSTALPDLVSTNERVTIVAEAIKQIQVETFRLEVTQTLNGHKHTDVVPGSSLSYDEQRDVYKLGLGRLNICYPTYIEIIGDSARGI